MIKILTVLGARPQFIKAAALSRAFNNNENFKEIIVHTGQHFDANMSDIFFEELKIPQPAYNLNIHGLGHGAMTGQMLVGLEEIILKEVPDYVLVFGDTNSTLAGALAAKKIKVNVIHVEAGLRSFNMNMPEEINRILTDRISDLLFCPTETAVQNLTKEGFDGFGATVIKVGDVMLDAARHYAAQVSVAKELKELEIKDGQFVLCTLHRAETTDNQERLFTVLETLAEIAEGGLDVVMPIHPRTRMKLSNRNYKNIRFIEPVGYLRMLALLKGCRLVMTDSGGLQKEAYFFEKHCITLRNETEWIELVENGYNFIAGYDPALIRSLFFRLIEKPWKKGVNLYGDGKAASAIVDAIEKHHQLVK